jgi:hypothetical protein
MEGLNFTGIFAAINTLVFIGIGFLWVIKLDYWFGACIKRIILTVGILLLILSLLITNFTWASITGLLAGTVIWGASEMEDQELRSQKGIFPDNPNKFCNKINNGFIFTSKKLKQNGNQ